MRKLALPCVSLVVLAAHGWACSADQGGTATNSIGRGGTSPSGGSSGSAAGGAAGSSTGATAGDSGLGGFGGLGGALTGTDEDGDGISDEDEGKTAAGGPTDTDGDLTPDYQDQDSDMDGILDEDEQLGGDDFDGDGIWNFRDPDSDGDGIDDSVEGTMDHDGDQWPDSLDLDSDQDGIEDMIEGGGDTDADGIADYLDDDSDADGLSDLIEGPGDNDGDTIPNSKDTFNNGTPPPIVLTQISTTFNSPIGIDYHEPTNTLALSVNYPSGSPLNLERIELDGTHQPFSNFAGLTDEVKIATVRSNNPGGFVTGDLFVGNGVDGQITRVTDNGMTVINPWVNLQPMGGTGLMRGSLFVDRGVIGGDLVAATTTGQVWRIKSDGTATMVGSVGTHLEGMIVVPNAPARFGPIAGKIIAGAESQGLLYVFDPAGGPHTTFTLGVNIEDIDLINPYENFFGVNFSSSNLLGAPSTAFVSMVGDILIGQEAVTAGTSSLFRLQWDGAGLVAQPVPLATGSAVVTQWEHMTFAGAGVVEVPVPPPPTTPPPPPPPPPPK